MVYVSTSRSQESVILGRRITLMTSLSASQSLSLNALVEVSTGISMTSIAEPLRRETVKPFTKS